MSETDYIIEMQGIAKAFGGVSALKDVNISIKRGSCHAIVGENGAGKSTLMKILMGIIRKDAGTVKLNGNEIAVGNIQQAEKLGIAIVPQELSFISYFTVAENIFYGEEPTRKMKGFVDWKTLFRGCEAELKKLKIDLPVKAKASELNVSDQQMMVIARVLSKKADIILMDEPTARLGHEEVQKLLDYIKYLQSIGKTIIYISHRLEEIFAVCDTVTVMRDGHVIDTLPIGELDNDKLISMMVNRMTNLNLEDERNNNIGDIVFSVENLNKRGVLKDVSFNVRSGEIVGMFGLVGAGRTEAIRATLGVDQYDSAKITLEGKPVKFRNIGQAFNAGVVLVPEDRRKQGILPNTPIYKNVTMGCLKSFERFGLINRKKELAYAKKSTDMLSVACSSMKQTVGSLSGGNQQKVVISKYINRDVKVFILDEPTRGIDVGAKDQIYHIIEGLAKKGMAVIVISSEIPELQRLCDRICIMSEGKVTGEISRKDFADSDKILRNAIGV